MTSGMQGGDLIIVAGRPSMGKTSFSMNIGEHVAIEQGLPVAVFSMEMGAVQLAMRMLGSVGLLDQHRMPHAGRAGLHRRDAGVEPDGSARAHAPPGPPMRPAGPDHHRLPATDVRQRLR
ncbi:hypothetical protein G6F65_021053 [Rhizopus arrhizus]|nr:hypothetical protein G6F65_021053 [Rhizopus arrhizus]